MADFALLRPFSPNWMYAGAQTQGQQCWCGQRFTQMMLVALLVVTLGGDSLICIIHCHLVQLLAPPSVTIYGVTLSLCHSPLDPSASTPPPLDPTLLYGAQLTPPILCLLLIVQLLATLHLLLLPLLRACVIAPDPPPPRSA